MAYFAGAAICLLRLAAGMCGGQRLRRDAIPVQDPKLLRLIGDQAHNFGLRLIPTVAYCERVSVPIVFGVLRPVVLLPASIVTGLDPDQFAAIIGHELAHIRRFDLLMNLFQRLIESLLFFHPVVWYFSRRMSAEREACCDDMVVSAGYDAIDYAGALLRMAELCPPNQRTGLAAVAASGGNETQFERRVRRLLNGTECSGVSLSRAGIATLALLVMLLALAPAMLRNSVQGQQTSQVADGKQDERSVTTERATQPKTSESSIPGKGIMTLAFSRDGEWLAGASADKTIKIWKPDQRSGEVQTLREHDAPVQAVYFTPDGKSLISVAGKVCRWDVETWRLVEATKLKDWHPSVEIRAISPDGSLIATTRQDNEPKLYDATTGAVVRTLPLKGQGLCATFSPDGKTIATGTIALAGDKSRGTLQTWNVASGELLQTKDVHPVSVTAAAYSPDGKMLAYGDYRKVVLVNSESLETEREFYGMSGVIESLCFAPDGAALAAGAQGPALQLPHESFLLSETKLWDLKTGRLTWNNVGELGRTTGIAFSPDGEWLARSDYDSVLVRNQKDPRVNWVRYYSTSRRLGERLREARRPRNGGDEPPAKAAAPSPGKNDKAAAIRYKSPPALAQSIEVPKQAWGEPVKGLRAAFLPDDVMANDGDTMVVSGSLIVENVSDQRIRLSDANQKVPLTIRDRAGKQIASHLRLMTWMDVYPSLVIRVQLEPGERAVLNQQCYVRAVSRRCQWKTNPQTRAAPPLRRRSAGHLPVLGRHAHRHLSASRGKRFERLARSDINRSYLGVCLRHVA